jgi:hypothetical protein
MADLVVERLTGVGMVRAAPVWRNTNGCEPWTATAPPPVQPDDCRLDPEPDDPVWDSVDWTVSDTAPDRAPPPWHLPTSVELQVVMSAETLLGINDEPALLRGSGGQAAYGPIAAQVAREIADAAARRTLIALFADPVDGRLLAMDSSSRFFTGRLRDFCVWRDQVCRLGGGRIAEVDHRDEVQAHGPTSARNGQSVARLSHRIKDHPGINARVVEPGSASVSDPTAPGQPAPWFEALRAAAPEVEWQMPTGHTYLNVPPPALGPGARPDPLAWLDQRDEREGYRHFVTACEQWT